MNNVFDFRNIKAIIGLGNPGIKYHKNRHSIGFRLIEALADRLQTTWHSGDQMEHASTRISDQQTGNSYELTLIKPLTYMNNSGRVLPWLLKKGIKPENILVMHDELEKPFGQYVIKFGGSHKGHNGLKSIMGVIGQDFWHLRFGIGRPADKADVPAYVLSDFSKSDEERIPELIENALDKIL